MISQKRNYIKSKTAPFLGIIVVYLGQFNFGTQRDLSDNVTGWIPRLGQQKT